MHYSVMNFAENWDNCHLQCKSGIVRHRFKKRAPQLSLNRSGFERNMRHPWLSCLRTFGQCTLYELILPHSFWVRRRENDPRAHLPFCPNTVELGSGAKAAEGTRRAWSLRRVFDGRLFAGQIEAGLPQRRSRSFGNMWTCGLSFKK
jgi:hypothetical protein